MKSKLVFAAIAALTLLGGITTSASASTCSSTSTVGVVNCDTFDLRTPGKALTAYSGDGVTESGWTTYLPYFLSTVGSIPYYQTFSGLISGSSFFTKEVNIASIPDYLDFAAVFLESRISYEMELSNGKLVSASGTVTQVTARTGYTVDGLFTESTTTKNVTMPKVSLPVPIQPVPGPEAGAGIGALAMGGMAVWLKRRRKDEVAA